MQLDSVKFGAASAVAFALLWLVCSLLVILIPGAMMETTGHMVHADLTNMQWRLGLTGFVFGLIAWSVLAGLTGWLVAAIYNRLV